MNLDFVSQIGNSLKSLFQPKTKVISPLPDTSQPTPTQNPLQQKIDKGIAKFSNPPPPIATLSAQLAKAGQGLPDPYLPTVLSLMETGGGAKQAHPNSLYNVGNATYPTPEVSILGGGANNQLGLKGLLRPGGLYQKYLTSGNVADFFPSFTPSSDPRNPSQAELVRRYMALRALFE